MTTPACKDCKFWYPEDPPIGECRRYAPRPPRPTDHRVIGWLQEIANQVRLTVRNDSSDEAAEWFNQTEEQTYKASRAWQEVEEDEWCGEFKPRESAQNLPASQQVDVSTLRPWAEFYEKLNVRIRGALSALADKKKVGRLGWDVWQSLMISDWMHKSGVEDWKSRAWVRRAMPYMPNIGDSSTDRIITAMAECGWPFRD